MAAAPPAGPLDAYVARKDGAYSWKFVRSIAAEGCTGDVLDLKSQAWRSEKEVNRTVWQHWLTVIRPERVRGETAMLFITGGSNGEGPPDRLDGTMARVARLTESVVAVLPCVPNQPLVFAGDKDRRRGEDSLLAYSWNKSMDTGDPNWIGQFAMVKSAVRAMDAVQEYLATKSPQKIRVERFVVSGASKRGWTTWLTGAADKRVVAIVPIVIDLLNIDPSMRHHYAAYGFWSPALRDYVEQGIMSRMDTPEMESLLRLVDPYFYRDRLTMPKFLINGSGDQFFLLDSSQFYFSDIPGENYLRYVPNAGHGLGNSDAQQSLTAYYYSILRQTPRPRFSWTFEKDGAIRVRTETKPLEVQLWQASNPNARDFRIDRLGPAWKATPLKQRGKGTYVASVPAPKKGWTAFFVELTFESGFQAPFKFTTAVRVLPETLPYQDKPVENNVEPRPEGR